MAAGRPSKYTDDLNWRANILKQIHIRNKIQCHYFRDLIQAQNKLFESVDIYKCKNAQLTLQTDKLRLELLYKPPDNSSDKSNDKTAALEQKLFKLQEELTELHRRKGENAQQLIDLNNALQDKEKELNTKDAKIQDIESNLIAMKVARKQLENAILDLEGTCQLLKDEQQALQMAYSSLEAKYRKIQDENRELVERWMIQKARDADRLNDDNEHQLRRRQVKLQKELEDAAKEVVNIVESKNPRHSSDSGPPTCLCVSIPTKVQIKVDGHEGEVNAICWSPSGKIFASGGADRKVKMWEIVNGICESKGNLTGSNAAVMSIEFDYEETLILGASNDFASRIWTICDQRLRHTLTGHSGKVSSAKFLNGSHKVVSGSLDRTLKIWDLQSRSCTKTIFAGSICYDLVTSDLSGTNIISGHHDKKIRFWDTRSEASSNEILLQGKITSLDISPDSQNLLSCSRDNALKVIDLRMNQVSQTLCADAFKVGCDWTRAKFSPDGQYAIVGSQDGAICIWSTSSGKLEKILKDHSHAVYACSWHPTNGSQILSCDRMRKIFLWSDF